MTETERKINDDPFDDPMMYVLNRINDVCLHVIGQTGTRVIDKDNLIKCLRFQADRLEVSDL